MPENSAAKTLFIIYLGVGLCVLASFAVLFLQLKPGSEKLPFYEDFSVFYEASALMHSGKAATVYRQSEQDLQAVMAGGTAHYFSNSFVNPPAFLPFIYPLATLAKPLALAIWTVLGLAAWMGVFLLPAVRRQFAPLLSQRWFSRGFPLFVLCAPYSYYPVEFGQADLFTGALLVAALCLRRDKPFASGAALGLLLIKPHLALALPVLLLAERNFKALLAASVTALLLCVASSACFGLNLWADWLHQLAPYKESLVKDTLGQSHALTSFYQALRAIGLTPQAALGIHTAIAVALIVLAVAITRRVQDFALRTALWLVLALMISPYLLVYNLCALLLAAFILASRALEKPSFAALGFAIIFAALPMLPAWIGLPAYVVAFALLSGFGYLLYTGGHDRPSITPA